MRTIASHPGAGLFRSILVISIILICITSFFIFTSNLGRQTEEVAIDQVVIEIKQALAFMLYDYAIKGQLSELTNFERENPFVPLAIYRSLPRNYRGVVSAEEGMNDYGWYFDSSMKEVIYNPANNAIQQKRYILKFEFEDMNSNRQFDVGVDKIKGLVLKKMR